jgi:hypothetical protein
MTRSKLTKSFDRDSAGEAVPRPYESTIFSVFRSGDAVRHPPFEASLIYFVNNVVSSKSEVRDTNINWHRALCSVAR